MKNNYTFLELFGDIDENLIYELLGHGKTGNHKITGY